jgi:hypothetical protein
MRGARDALEALVTMIERATDERERAGKKA